MEKSKKLVGVEWLIYQKIQALVQNEVYWNESRPKPWTKLIYDTLKDLGRDLHYTVYSSAQREDGHPGWLYDVIWSIDDDSDKQAEDWREFRGLGLIAEVEWGGYDAILHDFTKLTIGVAETRLMITNHNDGDKKNNQWEDIKSKCVQASKYRFQNFNYLLISIPYVEKQNLQYHSWNF